MGKFRTQKSKRRFGMAGGKHSAKRKSVYRESHTCRYKIKTQPKVKCQIKSNCLGKLVIIRQNVLRKYNITKARRAGLQRKLFVNCRKKDAYSIKRVSVHTPFKFKISRLKTVCEDGYRLVNLELLQKCLGEITLHTLSCVHLASMKHKITEPVKIIQEIRTQGLAAVLLLQCQGCKQTFKFTTSPQLHTEKSDHFDVNVRAVWGSMVTGGGVAHLNESMATFNAPGMSQQTFSVIEQEIGDMWGNVVLDDLLEAGAEERRIAIEKGQYHDDVPSISVICDGGWCKRSHKHSYSALGGVAIIIGAETGKLLYIGVRNKSCYICSRAEAQHVQPKAHRCFRNWSESSQAMEADIILEGFLKSEQMHGLRFTRIIADGDSSVFAKLQEKVPIWGKDIQKIECANHVCKCLRSNLEKLVEDNPCYKGKDRLTKRLRVRLTSAVRCAIRMRSLVSNKSLAAKQLAHDVRNSIHHILGNHTHCSDFCKVKSTPLGSINADNCSDDAINNAEIVSNAEESIPSLLENVATLWNETTSLEAQEESRGETSRIPVKIDTLMLQDISRLLDRVAAKSERLIGNFTTNLAESWMAVRAKFDCGKLYNRCNRGSWHYRCFGGCLRMNFGPQWSPKIWEKTTSSNPGHFFQQFYQRRDTALAYSKISKQQPENQARRWKRKCQALKESTSKRARKEYGPEAVDVPDIVTADLHKKTQHFLEIQINLPEDKILEIEKSTTAQSKSAVWIDERKKRITASNFGRIVKRNPKIPVKSLVKDLLYSNFSGNTHTSRGIQEEAMSIKEYITRKLEEGEEVKVSKVGLCISRKNKFLAASPDGKVVQKGDGKCGILEIKNLLHSKPFNLFEAAKEIKGFCLEPHNNTLRLKRNHNYYYQVQGQLNVTSLPWADFIVRTCNPYQLHIERIHIDTDLWVNQMLPKLKAFYHLAILPEIVCPRNTTVGGIREPGIWFLDKASKQSKCPNISRRKSSATSLLSSSPPVPGKKPTPLANKSAPSDPVQHLEERPHCSRERRSKKIKFLGRRISHEWTVDEVTQKTCWYSGTVVDLVSGKDGDSTAVYEVLYDGEDDPYRVDHLFEDYQSSSVKFIDI